MEENSLALHLQGATSILEFFIKAYLCYNIFYVYKNKKQN